jgi:pyruvate/2-oxoglutarate/acetoin dehydrogenase E1 component
MFADFVPVAMDQLVNQVAEYRYMSGGQFAVPLTVRAAQGGSNGFGTQHSQCAEAWLMSAPGIKVVVPATPTDAYGLLRAAIRDNNPAFFLEHKAPYNLRGDVPDNASPMELGKALVRRQGRDLTVVATQLVLHWSVQAVQKLAQEGIEVEVIDLRCMVPLDKETILDSIAKTNRLVVVEESPHVGGWGGYITSLAANEGIYWPDAPVKRVNLGPGLIPYSSSLEDAAIPNVEYIVQSVRDMVNC